MLAPALLSGMKGRRKVIPKKNPAAVALGNLCGKGRRRERMGGHVFEAARRVCGKRGLRSVQTCISTRPHLSVEEVRGKRRSEIVRKVRQPGGQGKVGLNRRVLVGRSKGC